MKFTRRFVQKLKNLMNLTIVVQDYNLIAEVPEFITKLRTLTLSACSGMNCELNTFERIRKERPVKCQILTAYMNKQLIGWAMLSQERSEFSYIRTAFQKGYLFEVYVDPAYRRQGIGEALLRKARLLAADDLHIVIHDIRSRSFYEKLSSLYDHTIV